MKRIHKKTLIIGIVGILLLISVLILGLLYMFNKNLDKSNIKVDDIPVNTEENIEYTEVKGITNILLLSSDAREGETISRSDSIIILTIDNNNNKVKLTSLMRDMLVNIEGHGEEKLNHAFAYGGPELMIKTIQNNFGIKLDNYAIINFSGFRNVIDLLGGVEVEVEDYEINELNKYILDGGGTKKDFISNAGTYNLNGYQALSYARIRKVGNGEYERTERQRDLLISLSHKVKSMKPLEIPKLINAGIDNVDTNLTIKDIINLTFTALDMDLSTIDTLQIPLNDACTSALYPVKGWVFIIDKVENSKALKEFIFNDNKDYKPSNVRISSLLEEYNQKYGVTHIEDSEEENPLEHKEEIKNPNDTEDKKQDKTDPNEDLNNKEETKPDDDKNNSENNNGNNNENNNENNNNENNNEDNNNNNNNSNTKPNEDNKDNVTNKDKQ